MRDILGTQIQTGQLITWVTWNKYKPDARRGRQAVGANIHCGRVDHWLEGRPRVKVFHSTLDWYAGRTVGVSKDAAVTVVGDLLDPSSLHLRRAAVPFEIIRQMKECEDADASCH